MANDQRNPELPFAASVEAANADDLPAMADLLHALFKLESDFAPQRDKQLKGLQLILDNPQLGRLFALRVGDDTGRRLAGMANALITVSTAEGCPVLLLEDVIVHHRYRGRGLGRQLVEHVIGWAQRQGMSRITLLADASNTPALAFYAKLGFRASAMNVLRLSW